MREHTGIPAKTKLTTCLPPVEDGARVVCKSLLNSVSVSCSRLLICNSNLASMTRCTMSKTCVRSVNPQFTGHLGAPTLGIQYQQLRSHREILPRGWFPFFTATKLKCAPILCSSASSLSESDSVADSSAESDDSYCTRIGMVMSLSCSDAWLRWSPVAMTFSADIGSSDTQSPNNYV